MENAAFVGALREKILRNLLGQLVFMLGYLIINVLKLGMKSIRNTGEMDILTKHILKIISYGFEEMDLARIGAIVFTENEAIQ